MLPGRGAHRQHPVDRPPSLLKQQDARRAFCDAGALELPYELLAQSLSISGRIRDGSRQAHAGPRLAVRGTRGLSWDILVSWLFISSPLHLVVGRLPISGAGASWDGWPSMRWPFWDFGRAGCGRHGQGGCAYRLMTEPHYRSLHQNHDARCSRKQREGELRGRLRWPSFCQTVYRQRSMGRLRDSSIRPSAWGLIASTEGVNPVAMGSSRSGRRRLRRQPPWPGMNGIPLA